MTVTRPFVMLFMAFGTTTGAFYAISTVLDQLVKPQGFSSVKRVCCEFSKNFLGRFWLFWIYHGFDWNCWSFGCWNSY